MPQLSPLPWVLFMFVSILPLVFVFLVSEAVLGMISVLTETKISVVEFSW